MALHEDSQYGYLHEVTFRSYSKICSQFSFKMYLSYTEIVVVIILDSISFTRLHMLKAEVSVGQK